MPSIDSKDIHKIIVACDAGMGSSVMLASQLRKQLKVHRRHRGAHPGQRHPGRRRRGALPRRARRPGQGLRSRQGAGAVPDLPRRPGRDQADRHDQERRHRRCADGPARPARRPAARERGQPGGRHPPVRARPGRRRRGRGAVHRGHARTRAVDLHLCRRGGGHPARHRRRQGGRHSGTRSAWCASPTASTGTASRSRSASASRPRTTGTWRCWPRSREILLDPDRARTLREARREVRHSG